MTAFCYFLVKDGVCPKAGPFGACVVTCGADEDCDGSKKCCSNGCGAWCVEPSKYHKPAFFASNLFTYAGALSTSFCRPLELLFCLFCKGLHYFTAL